MSCVVFPLHVVCHLMRHGNHPEIETLFIASNIEEQCATRVESPNRHMLFVLIVLVEEPEGVWT